MHAYTVQLFGTLWTVALQALLSMEFSKQEYWSQQVLPTPGDLPDPGIEPMSSASPALGGRFFTTELPGKSPNDNTMVLNWVTLSNDWRFFCVCHN